MSAKISTVVLGGTGYVAGELLRLIAGHPVQEMDDWTTISFEQ